MWYIPSFRFVGDTTNGSIRMPASEQYASNSIGFILSVTSVRVISDLRRVMVVELILIVVGVKGFISLITYTIYSQCLIYTNLFETNLPQYQRVISHWPSESYGWSLLSLLPPYHPIKVRNSHHKVKQNRFYFSTSYPHRRSRRYETMLHSPQNR